MTFLAEEQSEAAIFSGPLLVERAVMSSALETLNRLNTIDTTGYSREELAEHSFQFMRASDRVRTVSARFMAYADYNTAALTQGARKMSGVANARCGMSRRQGTQLNLIGTAAERYMLFYVALLEGRIGPGHIEVLHPIWKAVDKDQFNSCQARLVELAQLCTPEEFADQLDRWRNHTDEDAALDEYIANQAKQHIHYGFDLFGNVHYSGTVGPEHAEPFIESIETEAANHKTQDLKPSQARGKALVELVLNPDGKYRARLELLVPEKTENDDESGDVEATADSSETQRDRWAAQHSAQYSAARAKKARRAQQIPDPHDFGFATVNYPRTARGTLIPPAIVARIRRNGAKITQHTVAADGNIVGDQNLGRHFTKPQKRLIRLRDSRCRQPGCRRPAANCEFDHVEPYEHGGPTLIRNARALCRFHHRYKHRTDPGPHRPTIFDNSPLTVLLE